MSAKEGKIKISFYSEILKYMKKYVSIFDFKIHYKIGFNIK